jgi:nucleoid DNA-binding protein
MPADPVANVLGNSLKSLGTTNPSCPTQCSSTIVNESVVRGFSTGKLAKFSATAVFAFIETSPFREDMNYMRASLRGREELAARVRQALALPTKKEAEMVVETVVAALEATLLSNLETDGFTLKLASFGKFCVRHKPGILRRIGFSGETIQMKDGYPLEELLDRSGDVDNYRAHFLSLAGDSWVLGGAP